MINVSLEEKQLSDGSPVYSVAVNNDGETVSFDVVSLTDACSLVELLASALRKHTNYYVEVY